MAYDLWGHCPRCGVLPYMKANAGQFYWGCNCPPPQTYTSNNTPSPPPGKAQTNGERG